MPYTYTRELTYLRPYVTIQKVVSGKIAGTVYMQTNEGQYLAVPTWHAWHREARCVCAYGCMGRKAVYLEADDIQAFTQRIQALEAVHNARAVKIHAIAL